MTEASFFLSPPCENVHTVYLKTEADVCIQRIQERNIREEVDGYTAEYIGLLNEEHNTFFGESNNCIVLDWNENLPIENGLLYMQDCKAFANVLPQLQQSKTSMNMLILMIYLGLFSGLTFLSIYMSQK